MKFERIGSETKLTKWRHHFCIQASSQLITELDAFERLKIGTYCCGHSSAFMFVWIFFILTGKEDNHKTTDEFEIRPDPRSDYESSSKLLVTSIRLKGFKFENILAADALDN